jgi:membrane associated rhomboid family serine protease
MDLGLTSFGDLKQNFKFVSTTGIVTLTLIAIQLFASNTFTNCGDGTISRQVYHSLVHGSLMHLIVNIFTFIQLYKLEQTLGSFKYLILILLILLLSSALYWFMSKMLYGYVTCSVGFSGVLFGLLVWSRMVLNGGSFGANEIKLWALLLILPALQNPQISWLGHLSGLIIGFLLWPILSPILL